MPTATEILVEMKARAEVLQQTIDNVLASIKVEQDELAEIKAGIAAMTPFEPAPTPEPDPVVTAVPETPAA